MIYTSNPILNVLALSLASLALMIPAHAQEFVLDGQSMQAMRSRNVAPDFQFDGGLTPLSVVQSTNETVIVPVVVLPAEVVIATPPPPQSGGEQAPAPPTVSPPQPSPISPSNEGGSSGSNPTPFQEIAVIPQTPPQNSVTAPAPSTNASSDTTPTTSSTTNGDRTTQPVTTESEDGETFTVQEASPIDAIIPAAEPEQIEQPEPSFVTAEALPQEPQEISPEPSTTSAPIPSSPFTASLLSPVLSSIGVETVSLKTSVAITGIAVAEAGILTRLAMIHRYKSLYEAAPALRSLGTSGLFVMRPGTLSLAALIPPLPLFRRRKHSLHSASRS